MCDIRDVKKNNQINNENEMLFLKLFLKLFL